jgi:hypothetical protein
MNRERRREGGNDLFDLNIWWNLSGLRGFIRNAYSFNPVF